MALYEGIVLMGIKAQEEFTSKDKSGNTVQMVRFDDNDNQSGETAFFIQNVVKKGDKLEAQKITLDEAKEQLDKEKKPLFHIHGFNELPTSFLTNMNGKKEDIDEFNLVPICWPSLDLSIDPRNDQYSESRTLSENAGLAFQNLKDAMEVFTRKSIMCHSMGNRVLRFAADSSFTFDNIFMVAADVPNDLFWTEYIKEAGNDVNSINYDGMLIFKMLSTNVDGKPKGKIYVLHNGRDYALIASSRVKHGQTRLGQVGAYQFRRNVWRGWTENKDLIHEDIRGYVESIDIYPDLQWGKGASHSYQFDKFAIGIYEEKKIA